MKPADYLDLIVEPTLGEYEQEPTSVRRAFLACVAAFHTVDYLAHPNSPANLRKSLRDKSNSFALIDRIAHAFKHVETSNAASIEKQRLGVADIITRPPAIWDQMVWDISRWDDPHGGVTLDQLRDLDLLSELKSAVRFLRSQAEAR